MPIKWSPYRVRENMDTVEEIVNQAAVPLDQAKFFALEAMNLPHLPQYLVQRLNSLINNIERMDNIRKSIQSVRDTLPYDASKKLEDAGQLSLVA